MQFSVSMSSVIHQVKSPLILVLLLDVSLSTTLLRLANVVSFLSSSLGVTVASQTSDGASDCTSDAVGDPAGKVVELTLSFLALACGVLLLTFMLQ
jgi:hypothetical protein